MTKENLALALRGIWVSVGVWLSELEVRLHVDLRAALQHAQVVIHVLVERQDTMPCRLRVIASYRGITMSR